MTGVTFNSAYNYTNAPDAGFNFAGSFSGYNNVYNPFLNKLRADIAEFSNVTQINALEAQFTDIYNKQGAVGKVWDFIKNKLGMKNSSLGVKRTIGLYKNGKATENETIDAINKYAKGQQKALDFVADWGSTVIGAGVFALAMSFGVGIPVALGGAALGGAIFKTGTKKTDARSAGREYKTLPYDIVTGAINGLLSPLVNGIGNFVVKNAAVRMGLQNITNGAGGFVCNGIEDVIKYIALLPKQKLQGNIVKRFIAFGLGKTVRGIAKLGGAFALRQYVFAAFSKDAVAKNSLGGLSLVNIFGRDDLLDKIEKSEANQIDFSNNMYARIEPSANPNEKEKSKPQ